MRLLTLSAALLSTAFLLGCQEQASSAVGPYGPQFDKPTDEDVHGTVKPHGQDDNGDDATFTATFSGNLTTESGEEGELFGPHSGKQILSGGGVHRDPIPLTFNAFLETTFIDGYTSEEGGKCFGFGDRKFEGIMSIGKETPNSNVARISYWFTARDKQTGTTDVNYSFSMSGDLDPTKWPPALNTTTTIDGSSGTFLVGSNNSPASLACRGTGSVNFSVDVERTN